MDLGRRGRAPPDRPRHVQAVGSGPPAAIPATTPELCGGDSADNRGDQHRGGRLVGWSAGGADQAPARHCRRLAAESLGIAAVGTAPMSAFAATKAKAMIEQIAEEEHLTVLGWRVVPTDDRSLSDLTRSNMPYFEQLFVTAKHAPLMGIALDRLAYCL